MVSKVTFRADLAPDLIPDTNPGSPFTLDDVMNLWTFRASFRRRILMRVHCSPGDVILFEVRGGGSCADRKERNCEIE